MCLLKKVEWTFTYNLTFYQVEYYFINKYQKYVKNKLMCYNKNKKKT